MQNKKRPGSSINALLQEGVFFSRVFDRSKSKRISVFCKKRAIVQMEVGSSMVCWARNATLCSPPRWEPSSSEWLPLSNALNDIMKRYGSSVISCPASFLCCGFFCSSLRNNAALRQVELFVERSDLALVVKYRPVDVVFGPDCWIERTSVVSPGPTTYQNYVRP